MSAQLKPQLYRTRCSCRLCGSALQDLVDLGALALTSSFPARLETVPPVPLVLTQCKRCRLVQLRDTIDPALMYREGYGYASGINESMVAHLTRVVDDIAFRYAVGGSDLGSDRVLDIGCNDGTLLKVWEPYGVERYGVDPVAVDVPGCTITRSYFRPTSTRFRVVTSLAMFYDLESPTGFARDVAASLTDDGVWVVEVAYAGAILDGTWDGICHEHLEYYGVSQLVDIAATAGLRLAHLEETPTNGGSVLAHFTRTGTFDASPWLVRERGWSFSGVGRMIERSAREIHEAVSRFDTVDVLGASTKGNTLLQVARLGRTHIRQAVDRNPAKVGRALPGSGIPIVSEQEMRDRPPAAVLVLPYHFRESLLARERALLESGVRFIFPLPEVEIV